MDVTKLGARIKQRRTELGLTQKELAQAVNISNQLISKWETGEGIPSLEYLDALCKALQVEITYSTRDDDGQAEPAPPPAPQTSPKPKKSFKFNLKLFLIIGGSVFAALAITAVTLLTYYVFVPLANKQRYCDEIETAYEKYLSSGYYSITMKTELDGDEKTNYIYQGILDKNGNVSFYNSETDQTVTGGVMTYSYDSIYKYRYTQPAGIKTIEDLIDYQIFDDEEDEDLTSIDDINYIRKIGSSYYIEMKEEYFTKDLSGTQKKNIKILGKIAGEVRIENEMISYMGITVRYRNKPDNEDFTVKATVEFDPQKPEIKHTDLENRVWNEYSPSYGYVKSENLKTEAQFMSELSGGTARKCNVDTANDELLHAIFYDGLRYENGYLYAVTGTRSAIFLDPKTLAVTKNVTFDSDVNSLYAYGGKLYYSAPVSDYSKERAFCGLDLQTDQTFTVFTFKSNGNDNDIGYNGKYLWYDNAESWSSYESVVRETDGRTVAKYSDMSVAYVDTVGNVYFSDSGNDYKPAVHVSGTKTALKGDYFRTDYRRDDYKRVLGDEVYTADNQKIYRYKRGILTGEWFINDVRFQSNYCEIDDGYFFKSASYGDADIYNTDGSKRDYPQFIDFNNGTYYDAYMPYCILGEYKGKILINYSDKYLALYDLNDLSTPLCHTVYPDPYYTIASIEEVEYIKVGPMNIVAVRQSGNFEYDYAFWVF